MSFVSFDFYVFLAILFAVYFIIPKKYQWVILLIGSYIFYAYADIKMMGFLVITTISIFIAGLALDKSHKNQESLFTDKDSGWLKENKKSFIQQFAKERKRILLIVLFVNLGILGSLKYSSFVVNNLNPFLNNFEYGLLPELDLLLPLGISFYTFQSLGYLIDVYRGKYSADRNLGKFALFTSFFPQLVQGPISRHDQLANQLTQPHSFDYENFKFGLQRMLWGFFKKLVIADRAAMLVNSVMPNYTEYAGFEIGFTVLVFMIQVYADFSGGIDIALGVAQCLGINLVENFQRPFFATGISDYWKRWHITLGSWMKDYLLYPMTFSKWFGRFNKWCRKHMGLYFGKILPTSLAMAIVFLAVGVWHGPEWKYVAFGFYNGGLIIIGILLSGPLQKVKARYPWFTIENILIRILAILGTTFLVFIGKYFAIAATVPQAIELLVSTFSVFNPRDFMGTFLEKAKFVRFDLIVLSGSLIVLFIVGLMQEMGIRVREWVAQKPIVLRWTVYYILIFTILILGVRSLEGAIFAYQRF